MLAGRQRGPGACENRNSEFCLDAGDSDGMAEMLDLFHLERKVSELGRFLGFCNGADEVEWLFPKRSSLSRWFFIMAD